ncbi:unnamed protein product [Adineta steineri]|uniref:Uncharacterized protein n=1 Tax=Adineta steineri TaxID=433720 RepID=A0A814NLJ3_9BILA|nr:unnamed protein product [Adineta steineri]
MVVTNNPVTPTTKPLALVKDPQLQRSRKILLIMLGISLGLSLVNSFVQNVNYTGNLQTNTIVAIPIVSIAFDGFGLLVSYKYSEIGLRVFAWLGMIILVCMGIGFLWLFLGDVAVLAIVGVAFSAANSVNDNSTIRPSVDAAAIKGVMCFHFDNNYCHIRFQIGQTH